MSLKSNVPKKTTSNDDIPSWMFLCNKMNKSKNTNAQLREHAIGVGISVQGKSRTTLCRELAKNFHNTLNVENGGKVNTDKKVLSIDRGKNIDSLKVKLAKLIDNSEGGYSNYFNPQDIDDWEQGKSSYDYHAVLYNVRNLNIIKQNRRNLSKLYQFQDFPSFGQLLELLIDSIENLPLKDRQKYTISLKAIFTEDKVSDEDMGEFYEYDYPNEYGIYRSA